MKNENQSVEAHINSFPAQTQELLQQLRQFIRDIVPEAEEVISYGIPTFKLNGNLVHYAGYKSHIGFYPGASGIEQFREKLAEYKSAKGSVQFPIDQPIPFDLISEIVKFRVQENLELKARKKTAKVCPQGHKFYKSSDCPVCPVCEQQKIPQNSFLSLFSAPARRALEGRGINSASDLAVFTRNEVLSLHGIGKSALPVMQKALDEAGLDWKQD